MNKSLKNNLLVFSLLIMMILLSVKDIAAQEIIQVISTDIENNFPSSLTFQITVQSEKPIEKIFFYYKFQGSLSTQSQPIDFESSTNVNASYTWDTSGITNAPSTPIFYYWRIVDQDGNQLQTEEELTYYDDIRFDWQELKSSELILRWYEGDTEFGNRIFDVAQRSLAQMKEETNRELDFPLFIILYANEDDFKSWHYFVHDWVGGQAFPAFGVTTQIISPSANQEWIEDVIPHEIAHLFFYQIINAHANLWPAWLDEGFAQHYEFSPNESALEHVTQAAQNGDLIPLVLISGDFGSDPERVYLAYDESYSVVIYLLETWGEEGLQKLVKNFREGKNYRAAIEEAFGITWEEFEAGWITWLGVPTTPAPPPTATPTFVYLQAPEGWPTPTKMHTSTPVSQATETPIETKPASIVERPKSSKLIVLVMVVICMVSVLGLIFLLAIGLIVYRRVKKQAG